MAQPDLDRGAITEGIRQQCLRSVRVLSLLLLANLAETAGPRRQKNRATNVDLLCADVPRLQPSESSATHRRI